MSSRLETAAKASNILMSEDTYNLVRDSILCREADLITMKGFANPIRTFEVLDQSRAEETISVDADKSHLRVRVAALSKIEIEQLKESLEIALQKVQDHIQNR